MGESGAFFFLFLITSAGGSSVKSRQVIRPRAACTFPGSEDNRQFNLMLFLLS